MASTRAHSAPHHGVLAVALAVLGACTAHPPQQPPAQLAPPAQAATRPPVLAVPAPTPAAQLPPLPRTDAETVATLDRVLAGTHRSDVNRARDAYRHPRQTLEFFGIRQTQTVMEIWAGAGGWYTEILAPLLREHGRYIAANWDSNSDLKVVQDSVQAFKTKLDADPGTYDRVTVTALQYPTAMSPVPAGSVDLIVTFRNLHNWLARDAAAPAMLRAMFAALKPGGVLGIVDHRADPAAPVDPKAKTGYVNEALAIELAKSAGFEFVGASEINANPKDTRDYDQGVWTLPPTWRLGDKDRERYAAIGESDRFTLKFIKPLAH
jgi:predicted methyltransferase